MKLFVVWDTWGKSPPVISAGYDLKHAFNNHPLATEILDDENSRYNVGVITPEPADIK